MLMPTGGGNYIVLQGYCGRRLKTGTGGYRGATGEEGNIWEVVSALANALQDARNQLVNLMNASQPAPMRLYGGQTTSSYESCESRFRDFPHVSPGRMHSPARNVHRGHAHGHVAFGLNSEFPLPKTPSRGRPPRQTNVQMGAQQVARGSGSRPTGRRCTHPLHGMRAAASLTPRRVQAPPKPPPRSSQCDKLSRRDRAVVNISSGTTDVKPQPEPQAGAKDDHGRHDRCIGAQFVSLLKEEAHQLRERRLAESLKQKRPSWSKY